MNPIITLEKTFDTILYSFPPGKPDPQQTCQKDGEMRDRVRQAAAEIPHGYYAFNYLRKRVGKKFAAGLEEELEIEKIASAWRKAYTSLYKLIPRLVTLNLKCVQDFLTTIDRKAAQWLLSPRSAKWEGSDPFFNALAEVQKNLPNLDINSLVFSQIDNHPSLSTFLNSFLNENKFKNLKEFVDYKVYKTEIVIDKSLIEKLCPNSSEILNDIEKMEPSRKIIFYNRVAFDSLARAYNLKQTKWTPFKNIDCLIKELTENGPLVVGGEFGKTFYVNPPTNKITTYGKEICSWQQGAKRVESTGAQHIVIVGAKKVNDTAGVVFFIDVNEASDPKNPSSQKYYKISYKNLTSHIESTGIASGHSNDGAPNWGYHGNFKLT